MSFFYFKKRPPSVIHQISLSGLGGVQQSFVDYYRLAREKSSLHHMVFGNFDLDQRFGPVEDYYNLHRSTFSKIRFLAALCSSRHIVHFYNNLGSRAIRRLLRFIPDPLCLFHERGMAWNIPTAQGQAVRDNAAKAKIILANSKATKVLLVKKFGISDENIKVLYNGIQFVKPPEEKPPTLREHALSVGYIGRLDTPKGVPSLIEAARLLSACKAKISFRIAGSGPIEEMLRRQAKEIKNLFFLGAVSNPYVFLSCVDVVVVPSIREPFGNVIVEAGLM
ncbi:MAG: glycosyltransferase, partial [Desulfobacteraceae bacterium]